MPDDIRQSIMDKIHARQAVAVSASFERRLIQKWFKVAKREAALRQMSPPPACFEEVDEAGPVPAWCVRTWTPATPIHADPACTETQRCKNFPKTPFAQAFVDLLTRVPTRGRPLAMVFPRRGLQRGLVLHNDQSGAALSGGFCQVFVGKASSGDSPYFYLQSFDDAVRQLAAAGGLF